jgi:hypothetical protein
MIKNILIIFFFVLRIIVVYSIIKILYKSYNNFFNLDLKECVWWSLVLIFDIWLNIIISPFKELDNGEK